MGIYITLKPFLYIIPGISSKARTCTYYVNELSRSKTLKIETRYPLMGSHESDKY